MRSFTAIAAAVAVAAAAHAAAAACLPVAGDVNGSGSTDVTDVVCLAQTGIWAYLGKAGPPPACLAVSDADADIDCSGSIDVPDVQLVVLMSLGMALPPSFDADGDACVDACLGNCFQDWNVGLPCNGTDYGNGCTPDLTGFHFRGVFNGQACWWHTRNQAWYSPSTNLYQLALAFGLDPSTGGSSWCHTFAETPAPPYGSNNYFNVNDTTAWGWCAESDPNMGGWACIDAAGGVPCP